MSDKPYKALTIYQPHAALITAPLKDGRKEYETRGWATSYRGLLMIHAGKHWTKEEWRIADSLLHRFPGLGDVFDPEHVGKMTFPLGAIVGAVRLIDCIPTEKLVGVISDQERAFGDFSRGRYGWKMQLLKLPAKPIPAKGDKGIWDWYPTIP